MEGQDNNIFCHFTSLQLLEEIIPSTFQSLKNIDVALLPKIESGRHENIFSYLFFGLILNHQYLTGNIFVEFEKYLDSNTLTSEQATHLHKILSPFYSQAWAPTLYESWKNNQGGMLSKMWKRNPFSHQSTELQLTQKDFQRVVKTLLDWKLELNFTNLTASQTLRKFKQYLENTETKKNCPSSISALLHTFFSNYIFHIDTDFESNVASFNHNITKLETKSELVVFMMKYSDYKVELLDDLFLLHYKLVRKDKIDVAFHLKQEIELAFQVKFQDPLITKLFSGKEPTEVAPMKTQLLNFVNSVEKFQQRHSILETLLHDVQQNPNSFVWDISFNHLKQVILKKSGYSKLFGKIMDTTEKTKHQISSLKSLALILKHSQFHPSELKPLELNLIRVQNYLREPQNEMAFTSEVIQEFREQVQTFWQKELSIEVLQKIRDKYDAEKYLQWKSSAANDIQENYVSNKILKPSELEAFVNLRLQQLIYFGMIQGKFEKLQQLSQNLGYFEGDEIQILGQIFEEIDNSLIIPCNCSGSKFIFNQINGPLNQLISQNKLRPEEIVDAVLDFVTKCQALIPSLPANQKKLDESLTNYEVLLVMNWKNLTALSQFQTDADELNHEQLGLWQTQQDNLISKFGDLIKFLKKSKHNIPWKARLVKFVNTVKNMVLNSLVSNEFATLLSSHTDILANHIQEVLETFEKRASSRISTLIANSLTE